MACRDPLSSPAAPVPSALVAAELLSAGDDVRALAVLDAQVNEHEAASGLA